MQRTPIVLAGLLALAGCQADAPTGTVPGDSQGTAPYSGISTEETVHFTGTEPFWGGEVRGQTLRYSTPEMPDGLVIAVTSFAGRGGISWSGTLDGASFTLAVTPGECSDGMSDRRYPFVATLAVKGEQRSGCAWTDRNPASDSRAGE